MGKSMNLTRGCINLRDLLSAAGIIFGVLVLLIARPVGAATTLPVLWSAGGLSAGNDSAGQAARIATDASGNVAVVSGPAGGRDLAVTSYTADGILRWSSTVIPASGTFYGDWVAAAPNGDVVAVGTSRTVSSGKTIQITLVRFGADGALQWRVDLARTLPTVARLLVDSAGNTYLAFNSVGDGQDIQLHKYDPSGTLLWSQVINTGAVTTDVATSLALGPDEADVVVTGVVGFDGIIASYNSSTGTLNWQVSAPASAVLDVVIDASRVYVSGQGVTDVGTPAIKYHLTAIAYDRSTGERLWRTDKTPADSTNAAGLRMAKAPDGSLVVTGQALRGFLDWYTVAFETSGTVRWEAVRDGGLSTDEIPTDVLVLADGTAVVTGRGGPNLPGGFWPGITAGYSSNGTLLWTAQSSLPTVWATTLPSGNVCTTGGYDALITCWNVVGSSNLPPVAVATADITSGYAPLTVNFSSAGSSDPDGSIAVYSWSFGDGTSSSAANPAHTYSVPGSYVAALTVTDTNNVSSSASVTITVSKAAACTVNCLRSNNISLTGTIVRGKVSVSGSVYVVDEKGRRLQNALVTVEWKRPDGTTQTQSDDADRSGRATFASSGAAGAYTLTVTGITLSGYKFDPDNSMLSKVIRILR